jgi:hypothetical protein
MENKETHFSKFLNKDNHRYQTDVWYRAYGITLEKTELFYDFTKTLYIVIDKTYLGPDVIITEEEQKSHFTWCWDKVIDDLKKEKINFNNKGIHYEYFWEFFLESFYYVMIEGETIKINEYLYKLFDYNHKKTRSELGVLSEIYKILEKNLT